MSPQLAGSIRIGGIARHAAHSNGRSFGGGPQMVEISRDSRRVYLTNSLYSAWDRQFYPRGAAGVAIMCNANPTGGIQLDPDFFVDFGDGYGAHQIHLEGGDCSTESFCYPSA
jgi:selenium-binding protein 1